VNFWLSKIVGTAHCSVISKFLYRCCIGTLCAIVRSLYTPRIGATRFEEDFRMSAKTATALLATALTVFASTASWAADSAAPVPATAPALAPLAAGQAAGVHEAQIYQPNQTLLWVGGIVVLGVGIGLLASGGHGHTSSSTTTGP
jgi:hypothetical protein